MATQTMTMTIKRGTIRKNDWPVNFKIRNHNANSGDNGSLQFTSGFVQLRIIGYNATNESEHYCEEVIIAKGSNADWPAIEVD